MIVSRPWGNFKVLAENERTTIKLITMKAGHRTSLQFHNKRTERWVVIQGRGTAIIQDMKYSLKDGDEVTIARENPHRLEAITDLTVLEISSGYFEEEDIVRLEDDYCRVN